MIDEPEQYQKTISGRLWPTHNGIYLEVHVVHLHQSALEVHDHLTGPVALAYLVVLPFPVNQALL